MALRGHMTYGEAHFIDYHVGNSFELRIPVIKSDHCEITADYCAITADCCTIAADYCACTNSRS